MLSYVGVRLVLIVWCLLHEELVKFVARFSA